MVRRGLTTLPRIALGLSLLAATACESRKLVVESNTSWSGAIGGNTTRSVEGRGNAEFGVSSGVFCWNFQKQTTGGSLRAYVTTSHITGSSTQSDATTTAQYGIVSGCVE